METNPNNLIQLNTDVSISRTVNYSSEDSDAAKVLESIFLMFEKEGIDTSITENLIIPFEKLLKTEVIFAGPKIDFGADNYIIAANHLGDLDVFKIALSLIKYGLKTKPSILAKKGWVDNIAINKLVGSHANLVCVERDNPLNARNLIANMVEYLINSNQLEELKLTRSLIGFYQQTISDINRNYPTRVNPGLLRIAALSGKKIIPVFNEFIDFTNPSRLVFGTPFNVNKDIAELRGIERKKATYIEQKRILEETLALQNSLSNLIQPILSDKHYQQDSIHLINDQELNNILSR